MLLSDSLFAWVDQSHWLIKEMSGIFFISWPLWFQKEIFEMFWEMAWSFEEWVVALRDGILPGIGRFCWRRPLFIPLKKFMFISVKKYISISVKKYIFILLKKCIFIPSKNVFWNIFPTRTIFSFSWRHFFSILQFKILLHLKISLLCPL